jgi:hypothetical protein
MPFVKLVIGVLRLKSKGVINSFFSLGWRDPSWPGAPLKLDCVLSAFIVDASLPFFTSGNSSFSLKSQVGLKITLRSKTDIDIRLYDVSENFRGRLDGQVCERIACAN